MVSDRVQMSQNRDSETCGRVGTGSKVKREQIKLAEIIWLGILRPPVCLNKSRGPDDEATNGLRSEPGDERSHG